MTISQKELREKLLAKPTAPASRKADPTKDFTRQVEIKGDVAEVELRGPVAEVNDEAARAFLEARGADPDLWVATGFRSSEWTMMGGDPGVSTRYTFARKGSPADDSAPKIDLDEIFKVIKKDRPKAARADGDYAYVVAAGDYQFGKIDGDGVEGTLERAINYLDESRDLLEMHRKRFDVGHVHLAFLGDHIEGFQSQGGANVWRTPLTLSEQIRLTRRTMTHAMRIFADSAERVSMAAVPGNHGDTTRFAGKGVTRYDDSHDTESLIALSDAAKLNANAYGHVEFYVPETDRMSVTLDLAGTVSVMLHGHQFNRGKHFDYWRGHSFNGGIPQDATLMLAGHLHHELLESEGMKTFFQVPSHESESTWYKNKTGTEGNPGLATFLTKSGLIKGLEIIR